MPWMATGSRIQLSAVLEEYMQLTSTYSHPSLKAWAAHGILTQAGINLGSKLSLHLPLSNDLVWFIVFCWFIVISLVQNLTPIWEHFGFHASATLRTL